MQPPLLRPDSVFALRHPRIIHEGVDAETALIINLDRGVYYDMRGVACTIWKSALAGLPLEAIAAEVERHHSDCEDRLREVVAQFVQSLLDEELLAVAARAPSAAAERRDGCEKTPYRAPALERYTDLEELLRADPIHEVLEPEGA